MTLGQRFAANSVASLRMLVRPPRVPAERQALLWPLKGWIILAAVLALGVAIASMIVLDAWLAGQARELPRWLSKTFVWITWFGTADWFLWPTGVLLFLLAMSPLDRLSRFHRAVLAAIFVRASFVFLAIGFPVLVVAIIKRLIGRARPYVPEIVDPFSYEPFGWQESYASLPSGHATNAFAAAIAIGALWPKARLPMWIFAVVIAASRIIVTAHYPSDVIAGAVIGTTGAILVRGWFAARRLGFIVGGDGTIHRLPGPSWRRTKAVARRLLGH
jgi:undecaprenyl-diphosphatase